MKISDLWLLITLIITVVIIIFSIIIGWKLPNYFAFWWVVLLPIVFTKMFYPKSKMHNWFDKEIF